MVKKLTFLFFVAILFSAIVGCSSNDAKPAESSQQEYTASDFDFSLFGSSGNEVRVLPNQKALYVYFTGAS